MGLNWVLNGPPIIDGAVLGTTRLSFSGFCCLEQGWTCTPCSVFSVLTFARLTCQLSITLALGHILSPLSLGFKSSGATAFHTP
jgi:hypothetical protein